MKMPVSKGDIAPPTFSKPNKATRKRQSVSLPTEQVDQLNHYVEELTFTHRIKNVSLSEVVEAALSHFFETNSVEGMAKIAKRKRI